jgi:hypothetical protein
MPGLTLFLFAIGTSRSSVTSSQTLTSLFQPWQASIVHIVLKQEPESQFREPTPWFRGENIRLIRSQLDVAAPGRMTLHHRSRSRINVYSLVVYAKMWKHVNRGGLWQYEFAVCSTCLPNLTISTPFLQTTWEKIFLAHPVLPTSKPFGPILVKLGTVNAGYNDSRCNDIRSIRIRYACKSILLYKITIFSVFRYRKKNSHTYC